IDLCSELRGNPEYGQLFVLILTSFDDTASIEAAYRAGANDYIRKPFIPFEISSKIYQISRTINYYNGITRLYNQQKITNERLYKLATLINRNIHIADKKELISSLFQVSDFIHCDYCELALFSKNEEDELRGQQYTPDFQYIEYAGYKGKLRIFSDQSILLDTFHIKRKNGTVVYCQIAKVFYNKRHEGFLVLQKERNFPEEARDMLSLYLDFVNILGVDLTSKDMMRGEIHKERKELAKVRSLQVSLLPHFEEIDRYDIASTFIPMEEISGDFFDAFYVSEKVYQIVICDVSGHGAASSYIGSSIRGLLRMTENFHNGPGEIVRSLNDSVMRNLSNIYYFSSLILCQLNIMTGDITLVSAGHPACFYYDSTNRQYEKIENTGPLVGLIENASYDEKTLRLNVGDCLFMYTDGIIEAPAEKGGNMFGEDRLFACFQDNIERTSIDIVHTVVGTVYEHTGFTSLHDDATVICIKRTE
ncbi:MAG: SpoIIE family protein phosphatase, partial [Spirochaetota bacterium]